LPACTTRRDELPVVRVGQAAVQASGSITPARNSWPYGWGIHRTPHGWLYNVSGWEAVEVALASGKRLRLGTDEPRRLTQVLLVATRERA
jgi:hypothetical protein